MIPIVVCTYRPEYYNNLVSNIKETIGVDHEIIKIDNKDLGHGIAKVYNLGANKAVYPYLCFVHEDVIFKNEGWGRNLISKFEGGKDTGLIGVAGSKYKSLSPGPGWYNDSLDLDRLYLIQHNEEEPFVKMENQIKGEFDEVVSLDGVFLFTMHYIWQQNRFDEKTFTGFHYYDLDFSLLVNKKFKLFVTNQVLLEHYSPGQMQKSWIDESLKFAHKWRSALPIGHLRSELKKELEWRNKFWFLHKMKAYNYSFYKSASVLLKFGFFEFFSLTMFYRTLKMLLSSRN